MQHRDALSSWSIPFGTWFQTEVRVSVFLPLLIFLLCFRLESLHLGLAVGGVMFVSILLHEFGHIFATRWTGGDGDEILMWPLGGLAFVQPANTFRSQFLSVAGGPLVNVGLCLLAVFPVYQMGLFPRALNPFVLPIGGITDLSRDLVILTFAVNWILLLINLIPVMPLDGGQMLRTLAARSVGQRRAAEIGTIAGFGVAMVLMVVGLIIEKAWVVLMGALIFILNLIERQQLQQSEAYDDSFMGYDFSQGYTSLERDNEEEKVKRPGMIARWKERRRVEKERKRFEQEIEDERRLDELLEKVHQHGMESLSSTERRQLERSSNRYRERGKQED